MMKDLSRQRVRLGLFLKFVSWVEVFVFGFPEIASGSSECQMLSSLSEALGRFLSFFHGAEEPSVRGLW